MPSATIGSLRVNLGIDTAAFSDGLKGAGSKLAGFGAMARKAIVPLAGALTAGAVGMGVAVTRTINAADEMSKAASKFGIPIEELSRLKYAADLSDVSLETLGTSVGRLSRNMVEAQDGVGPAADAFKKLGIAVTDADGELRPTTDVMGDLADAFAAMPDGAEKTATAMELMGRSGTDMIPMLNEGKTALAGMMAEADSFGQVFTAEMGDQAEAFNDNITRLKGAFGNLAADLTVKLLPYLTQFTEWLVANGPAIADTVVQIVAFAAKIAEAADAVSLFIADTVTAVRDLFVQLDQALADIRDRFVQIGRDLIDGLLAGLREKWESVKAWFGGLAASMPEWLKVPLGIHSPSTVFAEIGRNVMQGLAGGLEANQGQIESGMSSFAQGLASSFADILSGAVSFKEALSSILGQQLGNIGAGLIQSGVGSIVGGIPGVGPLLTGQVAPEAGGGRPVLNFAPVIDARGADAAAVARIEASQRMMANEMRTSFRDNVATAISDRRFRGRI